MNWKGFDPHCVNYAQLLALRFAIQAGNKL